MKIKQLRVSEFLGCKYFQLINPDQNLIEIAGPNKAGKSSILKAVQAALGGKGKISSKPVYNGSSEGEVFLQIDDYEITLKVSDNGKSTLIVNNDNGSVGAKQTFLNSLLSSCTFDPRSFLTMESSKQLSIVKKLAGEQFCDDLESFEYMLESYTEERKALKREIKKTGKIARVEKTDPIDIGNVLLELTSAEEFNTEQQKLKNKKIGLESEIERIERDIEELKRGLILKELELNAIKIENEIDTLELKNKIYNAGETNKKAAQYNMYIESVNELSNKTVGVSKLDLDIKNTRAKIKNLFKDANLPNGIELNADGIFVNGTPLDQLSDSEGTRLGIQIGLRLNPELRVILIDRGEQFDNLDELYNLAKEFDIQFLVATRGKGHTENAIHIEFGEKEISF